MASGEEIQAALRGFVARWRAYAGSERGEAQTFLNELFACYGSDRREVGAVFEDFVSSAGFLDLHWPGVCIVEMKAPSVSLQSAQQQVERYWRESADFATGRAAARFVVLCSFQRFEVWEPGRFPTHAVASFSLDQLPERYDVLAFLAGPNVEPNFTEHHRELTKEAAKVVAQAFQALKDRSAAPVTVLQRFVLQSVWCMFAEDLGLLDGYPYQSTLSAVRSDPERSAAELLLLFRVLNQKSSYNRKGRLAGTRYVNGELFAEPADVELNRDEIELLLQATAFDWTKVDPTIFGSLMEGVLGRERRWELGAHYTHEVDIMKIVGPTIVRPWRERIAALSSATQARALLDELCGFRVLDPACGCGNFLYVAYRELRGLEQDLKQRIRALAAEQGTPVPPEPWPYYPLANLQGIDIEPTAVLIARVTLWMGHRQMIERFGEAEPALPLQDLSGIRVGDALRVTWPETDCIIGNPPFLGDRRIRAALGGDYVEWLKREFGVGVVDLSAYWFRRAVDVLRPGQRAGLVSTNTLRENKHRRASLSYVLERGGVITDAVSSQKWPGEAHVHVSITNWIAHPAATQSPAVLNGREVTGIDARLREGTAGEVHVLLANRGRSFIGCQPTGTGFLLPVAEAESLLSEDATACTVVKPYLTSEDLAEAVNQSPSRYIIDFGTMSLEDAGRYPAVLRIVRERVRPHRENAARHFARLWWQFAWPRPEMRVAVAPLDRFVASTLTGKRLLLSWATTAWCPSNATGVFAFEDDYSMGVLLSRAHEAWAWAQSSTLETRLRYTPSSVFETFPWPDPVTDAQRERVAEASRQLLARRGEICETEQIGLTKLYNAVDEGAWTDLVALHRELDVTVAACYGWLAAVAQDDAELVRRLTDLNQQITEGRPYDPFGHLNRDDRPAI